MHRRVQAQVPFSCHARAFVNPANIASAATSISHSGIVDLTYPAGSQVVSATCMSCDRPCSCSRRAAHCAGHKHRRGIADCRGRARCGGLRPGAPPTARPGVGPEPAADRAHLARVRGPAARPRRRAPHLSSPTLHITPVLMGQDSATGHPYAHNWISLAEEKKYSLTDIWLCSLQPSYGTLELRTHTWRQVGDTAVSD